MEAPSSSDVKIKEFRRSKLFKVTVRLIRMFMIYGGTGGERRGGYFDRGILGNRVG